MFQFIETIKVLNGKVLNLEWHQKRVNETFVANYPNYKPIDLSERYKDFEFAEKGKYKDRILYNEDSFSAELELYKAKEFNTLSFVEVDFDYSYKFLDRENINRVLRKSNTEEVIFLKNNHITDSSYSNLVFLRDNQWFTPKTYLLNGSCRQRLIFEERIIEAEINLENILSFEKIGFINSMIDLDEFTLPIFSKNNFMG